MRRDNYVRDLDLGAGYHLNQDNPVMHEVARGDSLWAFTRTADGRYVLAAELIVQAKMKNRPDFRYGTYRVWGDVDRSRYFRVEGAPSVEQIIRSLSIRAEARVLGRSFQGHAAVRRITGDDHRILREAARNLPLEPRARILPEEKLEAALIMGDRFSVERLVREEEPGVVEERKQYLYEEAPRRNPDLVDQLQRLYDGHCQVCRWDPVDEYGESLCEGHHIRWLSRGSDDAFDNLMLVCPNHHRAIHRCDAPLDWGDLAYDFGDHWEAVAVDRHLTWKCRHVGGRSTPRDQGPQILQQAPTFWFRNDIIRPACGRS